MTDYCQNQNYVTQFFTQFDLPIPNSQHSFCTKPNEKLLTNNKGTTIVVSKGCNPLGELHCVHEKTITLDNVR